MRTILLVVLAIALPASASAQTKIILTNQQGISYTGKDGKAFVLKEDEGGYTEFGTDARGAILKTWYGDECLAINAKAVSPDDAIAELTEQIRQIPTDGTCDLYLASLYKYRGIAWRMKLKDGENAKAKNAAALIASFADGNRLKALSSVWIASFADGNRLRASSSASVFAGDDLPIGNDVKDFTDSLRLNPRQADVYTHRGLSYVQKGKFVRKRKEDADIVDAFFDNAISDFDRALSINEKSGWAFFARGDARLKYWNGRWDEITEDFNNAAKPVLAANQKKAEADQNLKDATDKKAKDAAAAESKKNGATVDYLKKASDAAGQQVANALNKKQNPPKIDPVAAAQKDVDAAQIAYNQANQDYGKALDFWTKAYANLVAVNKDVLGNVTKVNIAAVNVNNVVVPNKEVLGYAARVFDRADAALMAKEKAWNEARDTLAAYNRVLVAAKDKKTTDDAANAPGPSNLEAARRAFDIASIDLRDSLADFTNTLGYQPCAESQLSTDRSEASKKLQEARDYLAHFEKLKNGKADFSTISDQTKKNSTVFNLRVELTEKAPVDLKLIANVKGSDISGTVTLAKGKTEVEVPVNIGKSVMAGDYVVELTATGDGTAPRITTFKLRVK